jgi:chemotaxis protein CheD
MRLSEKRLPDKLTRLLPGFEHITRYWDDARSINAAKIFPGEYYVTAGDEMILTVLGSCVSACIRDPLRGIGGMNHFMLPESSGDMGDHGYGGDVSAATRYGYHAMAHLINDILKHGGKRERLEVKLFGGGCLLPQMTDIGRRNIAFVREYIRQEGLHLVAEDLGNKYARKLLYFPTSGRVLMKKLRILHNDTLVKRERHYLRLLQQPIHGEIKRF